MSKSQSHAARMRIVVGTALVGAATVCPWADAAWGLKYEVSLDGQNWSATLNASPGNVVRFRVGAYFDLGTQVTTASGTGSAIATYKFTGSNKFVGLTGSDSIGGLVRVAATGGTQILTVNGNVIGTTSITSFAGQLILNLQPYVLSPQTFYPLYTGQLTLDASATGRTITMTNNTFGTGSTKGLLLNHSGALTSNENGQPAGTPTFVDATIQVGGGFCPPVEVTSSSSNGNAVPSRPLILSAVTSGADTWRWYKGATPLTDTARLQGTGTATLTIAEPVPTDAGNYHIVVNNGCGNTVIAPNVNVSIACMGDLNRDSFIDDADFVIFAAAYNDLTCPIVDNCPADLNRNGTVDDGDFVYFAFEYNLLICP